MSTKHSEISLAFQLGLTLRTIGKSIHVEFMDKNMTLSVKQFGLLDFISMDYNVIQTELANIMDRDKSAVLREIDVLEEQGFITRVSDPVDRRKKFVVVTDEGKKALKTGRKYIDNVTAKLFEGLSTEEVENFRKVLVYIENKAKQ